MKHPTLEAWMTENGLAPRNTEEMAKAMKDYLEWVFHNSHKIEGQTTTVIAREFQGAMMSADLDWPLSRIEMSWWQSKVAILEEQLELKPAQKRPLTRQSCPAEEQHVLIWTEGGRILTAHSQYTEIFGEERVLSSFRTDKDQFSIGWRSVTGWCPIERS